MFLEAWVARNLTKLEIQMEASAVVEAVEIGVQAVEDIPVAEVELVILMAAAAAVPLIPVLASLTLQELEKVTVR